MISLFIFSLALALGPVTVDCERRERAHYVREHTFTTGLVHKNHCGTRVSPDMRARCPRSISARTVVRAGGGASGDQARANVPHELCHTCAGIKEG